MAATAAKQAKTAKTSATAPASPTGPISLAYSVPSTVAPSEMATCCVVTRTPEPAPAWCAATPERAKRKVGLTTQPMAKPSRIINISARRSGTRGQVSSMATERAVSMMPWPTVPASTTRGPTRPSSRDAARDAVPNATAIGTMARPAVSGPKPRPRECDEVAPGTLLVLERLGNYPAVVLNGRYDVLAYNRAYEALVGDLGSLCFDERNVLWLIFTSPTMRELLVDWEQVARTCVARYRARMATHASERAWRGLVKRLAAASEDFTRIWGEHEVTGTDTTLKRFAHAELGLLSYDATVYSCTERVGNRFIAYTPADEVTTRRTEDLINLVPRALDCSPAA